MNYGSGSVLGVTTVLPSTAATGMLLLGKGQPAIIIGLFSVSLISFFLLIAQISRYLKNCKV